MNLENIKQDLLETIGDWLDSETLNFEIIFNNIEISIEDFDNLHIYMVEAAMKVFKCIFFYF